ncbi:hypothetical protein GOP47_0011054 [Adiantum capillus-veneris]|uniref:Uncharacterized protein n=1 Tax=Adiantum capillus-veneris TaxID=13818 RepID=A0A9D4US76_ADICA|nr:hypothetical protein GOP47_0011054 [Adiantum capillus-veneris]
MDSDHRLPPPPPGPPPHNAISYKEYIRYLRAERWKRGRSPTNDPRAIEAEDRTAVDERYLEGQLCPETTDHARNRTTRSRREEAPRSLVQKESGRLRPEGIIDADVTGEAEPCQKKSPATAKSPSKQSHRRRSRSESSPSQERSCAAGPSSLFTGARDRHIDISHMHPRLSECKQAEPGDVVEHHLLTAPSSPQEEADLSAAATSPQKIRPQREVGDQRKELAATTLRRSPRHRLPRSPHGPAPTQANLFLGEYGESLHSVIVQSPDVAVESPLANNEGYRTEGATGCNAEGIDQACGNSALTKAELLSTARKRPQSAALKVSGLVDYDAQRSPALSDRRRRKNSATKNARNALQRPSPPKKEESFGLAMPINKLDFLSPPSRNESGRRLPPDPMEAHEVADSLRPRKGTVTDNPLHQISADTKRCEGRSDRPRSLSTQRLQQPGPAINAASAVLNEAEKLEDEDRRGRRASSRGKLASIVVRGLSCSIQDEQACSRSNLKRERTEKSREEFAAAIPPVEPEVGVRRCGADGGSTEDSRHISDRGSGRRRQEQASRQQTESGRKILSVGPTSQPALPLHNYNVSGIGAPRYPVHQLAGASQSAQRHRYPLHQLPYAAAPASSPPFQHQQRVGQTPLAHPRRYSSSRPVVSERRSDGRARSSSRRRPDQRLDRRHGADEARLLQKRHENSDYRPSQRAAGVDHGRSTAAGAHPNVEQRRLGHRYAEGSSAHTRNEEDRTIMSRETTTAAAGDHGDPRSPRKRSRFRSPRRRAADRNFISSEERTATIGTGDHGSPKKRSRSGSPRRQAADRKFISREKGTGEDNVPATAAARDHRPPRSPKKRSRTRSPRRQAADRSFISREEEVTATAAHAAGVHGVPRSTKKRNRSKSPRRRGGAKRSRASIRQQLTT